MNIGERKILEAFREADGHFLSVERLKQLDGNRRGSDVPGRIGQLTELEELVQAIGGYGYRLVEEDLVLREKRFSESLPSTFIGKDALFFRTLSSTQNMAKELAALGAKEGTVILADEQTAGRGRMTRKWHSPKGDGLWFSLIIKPDIPIHRAPQLTLLTSVAVAQSIEDLSPIVPSIKWPNDVRIKGRKVCGILTELQAEEGKIRSIIIGVGINLSQKPADFPEDIRPIATSIELETGTPIDSISLLQRFCLRFEKLYETFLQHGFLPIKTLWEAYSDTIGKEVVARTLKGTVRGVAIGISEEGALLLKEKDGTVTEIYSADIDR